MTDAYSIIVLTKAKHALDLSGHCFKFLCKNPWTECALLVIIEICLFQLTLLVMVTPRYRTW